MVQISHLLIAQSFNCLTKKLLLEKAQERYWRIWQLINRKLPCLEWGHFFKATASHLKEKLPLGNELLRQSGCLNPTKRHKQSGVLSLENIASVLQPKINSTEVVDEWKVFHVDSELPSYNQSEWIEVFWNGVFQLQSADGDLRYKLLPVVIKSALVLTQTNVES